MTEAKFIEYIYLSNKESFISFVEYLLFAYQRKGISRSSSSLDYGEWFCKYTYVLMTV